MKFLKLASGHFTQKLLVLILFAVSYSANAQSWMKAIGTKNQGASVNQFIMLPDSMMYLRGDFTGADSLKSSDPKESNLLKSDSLRNSFVLQMDGNGKIRHKFTYKFRSNRGDASIVAGDAKGNYVMAGPCTNVQMPGDTFTTKEITLNANSWLENASIEMLDSSSHVKWHYLLKYNEVLHIDYVTGGFSLDTAWSDSSGNWYFLLGGDIQIQNDSLWNYTVKDSSAFVLLKLDANGNHIWHKRLRDAKQLSIDKSGNILSYFDANGFESNSIALFDSSYHLKWKHILYQDATTYISKAQFSNAGTILVQYSDSILEYSLAGKRVNYYRVTYNSPTWSSLAGPSYFIYSLNNYYARKNANEIDVTYSKYGSTTLQRISYFTSYNDKAGNVMASLQDALLGPGGALYVVWYLNTDTLHSQPNAFYTIYDSVTGFRLGAIVVTRLSPQLNYLDGIKPQTISQSMDAYPNPTADFITIQLPVDKKGTAIEIYDMPGQLVAEYPYSGGYKSLDVSSLKAGVYIVKVENGAGLFYGKFVKTQAY